MRTLRSFGLTALAASVALLASTAFADTTVSDGPIAPSFPTVTGQQGCNRAIVETGLPTAEEAASEQTIRVTVNQDRKQVAQTTLQTPLNKTATTAVTKNTGYYGFLPDGSLGQTSVETGYFLQVTPVAEANGTAILTYAVNVADLVALRDFTAPDKSTMPQSFQSPEVHVMQACGSVKVKTDTPTVVYKSQGYSITIERVSAATPSTVASR